MNVNLKAVFHLCQLFINHCLKHDRMGSILNITSQAAFHGSTTGMHTTRQVRPALSLRYLSGAGSRKTKNQCEQYRRGDHGYRDDPQKS